MPGKYPVPKQGVDAFAAELKLIWKAINALRSSAGLLSAIIGKGGVTVRDGGSILIKDGGGVYADGGFITTRGGNIRAVDADTNANLAYFGKLLFGDVPASGLMTQTSAGDPYFWVAERLGGLREFFFAGGSARIDADTLTFNSPKTLMYQLGNTGDNPNLAISVVNGEPILRLSTSSERYKTDLAPITVDVEDMRAYTGISWVHNSTLDESEPGDIRRNVGHHAEGMDARPSLRQFVNYDDDARPDSVEPIGFGVAVHEYVKDVDSRVIELEQAVESRDKAIADLSSALARVPARGMAATPVLALAASRDITVALDKPMPDTDYAVDVLLVGSAAGGTFTVKAKTKTSVTVTVKAAIALGAGSLFVTARYPQTNQGA